MFSQHYFIIVDYNNIGKFLNRILGMEVHQQNALFQYFSETLAAVIQEAKRNGRYDMGILGELRMSDTIDWKCLTKLRHEVF